MNYNLQIIDSGNDKIEEFIRLAHEKRIVAVDIESSGLDPYTDDLLLVQFAVPNGDSTSVYVILARDFSKPLRTAINRLTSDSSITFLAHNAKFDSKFLDYNCRIQIDNFWDTQITEAGLTLGKQLRTSLDKVVERRFNMDMNKDIRNQFIGMSPNSHFTDEQIKYAAEDVVVLFDIYEQQKKEAKQLGLTKVVKLENKLVPVTAKLELNGVLLNENRWLEVVSDNEKEILRVLKDLYGLVGFDRLVQTSFLDERRVRIEQLIETMNPNHPETVLGYLHKLGYTKAEDTTAQTLQALEGEFPELMLDYRKYNKRLTTYLWPMFERINPVSGRVHPDYNQLPTFDNRRNKTMGTTTGRYSSNFQQIPRDNRIRNCFVAREGYKIITADYSGVEYRIVANISKDDKLTDFFLSDMNDIHSYSASLIYGVDVSNVKKEQRQIAKNLNYAYIYGATAKGLSWRYNIDLDTMQHAFNQYEKSFPSVKDTMERFAMYAQQKGEIRDAIGRIKFFDLEKENEWEVRRKAMNFPIQATSASQMKYAMYNMYKEFSEPDVYFYASVHDEIVLEVKEEIAEEVAKRQVEIMENSAFIVCPGPIPYPVDYTIDDYWVK